MFQSFEVTSRPDQGPPRLAMLRAELEAEDLDGFLVPRADLHQGEYVAPRDDRLAWLTGFTGSAGFCAALREVAGVFVDGRYRLQVRNQVDGQSFTPVNWPETKPGPWLLETLRGGTIGYDPWLHTRDEITSLDKALDGKITLRPCENLIDRIWQDQPAAPLGAIRCHPEELAGESSGAKRARLGEDLRAAGQTAAVLTLPDSISWLLNIRGSDIPRNPVVHALAILRADASLTLFVDPAKLSPEVITHLGPEVDIADPSDFVPALQALAGSVRVDGATAPMAVSDILSAAGVDVAFAQDPCILPKACKTPAEIAGTRAAHLRDGAAMAEFLAWLDASDPAELTEIDVATALEGFRRATNALEDISFETISGAGPHGAIVHYRVTEATNRTVSPGDLLLVDSGGQYQDGTTDITRTIATGEPPEGAREAFTRVLQGMIAISRARFPTGVAGRDLDALARAPLWMAGQDYDHGTGHGVGVFLSVHEGPQRLSRASHVPLEPGMILSNEPGYYREGAFGIRIENLIVTRPAPDLPGQDEREMLCFETLTYVPIDTRLIIPELLSPDEREWLNNYHADVKAKIRDRLSDAARDWLDKATRAI